jgi:hypothetical protein
VTAVDQPGGFSPGAATRLRLTNARQAFVKAVGSRANPDAPDLHRSEARITGQLPRSALAPTLLFSFEMEIEGEDWVILGFEDLEGRHPHLPWRPTELRVVLQGLSDLAEALTPSPVEAPDVRDGLAEAFTGWRRLVHAPPPRLALLDPWARANLGRLVDLESRWADGAAGRTLVHSDIRADNLLLVEDSVAFIDWPHARIGASWLDLVFFLPSVAMQGGPAPWEVFDAHPLGRSAEAEVVDSTVCALAGYFAERATSPPPLGLPTVREFQRAQGVEALAWLRHRLTNRTGS